ncbi:MAG: cytochrome c3 family protein [Syntrophales bacterium]|nr:cytochrome c3 family protein [Syntrophales bacterium]
MTHKLFLKRGLPFGTKAIGLIFIIFLFSLFHTGPEEAFSQDPTRVRDAKPGNCASCHKEQVIPSAHPDTSGMNLTQCLSCHKEEDPKLTNTFPLSHSHLLSGVSCAGCHGEADPPEFVGTGTCLGCHKTEDLVAATKDVKDANPHDSHYGPELDCDLCHHAHKESENFCNQCHEFDFVVPSPIVKPAKAVKRAAPVKDAAPVETAPKKKMDRAPPDAGKPEEAVLNCRGCHSAPEYTEKFDRSVHGLLACTTCHTGIENVAQHMKKETKTELTPCAACHSAISVQFEDDVHGVEAKMTCAACHTDVHIRMAGAGGTKAAVINRCTTCHSKDQYVQFGHAKEVLQGNEDSAGCSDCHGLHDIAVFKETIEDKALQRESFMAACISCHDNQELVRRNNLSTDIVESYEETYHGKVLHIGFPERVAGCADCHNGHNILPATDPQSTVHPDNLIKDCKACHSGFHARFVKFEAHADYSNSERYPVLFWTNAFMIALLVCVFFFFWVHSILWWRKAYWKKWKDRGAAPTEENIPFALETVLYVQRFSWRDRIMHILLVVSFFLLVMTGFPIKYAESAWAEVLINLMGGPQMTGLLHRISAIVLWALFLYTCWLSLKFLFPKRQVRGWTKRLFGPESLFFNKKDWEDLKGMFRWFFNRGEMPQFERWTYWEKFDFFAVFWGMFVIGLSGLMLWLPELFSYILPGWMINVATVAHSEEAFLAAIFIFTVHFFHNHLAPNKFPMESNIFTGRYTVAALKEERPEEYERMIAENRLASLERKAPSVPSRFFAAFVGIAAVLLGLLLTVLIFWAALFY